MGLKSNKDWSGRMVNGVILGVPAREFYDEDGVGSGAYIWDGGVPTGDVTVDGDVMVKQPDEADRDKMVVVKSELKLSEVQVEELADLLIRKKGEGVYVHPVEVEPVDPKPEKEVKT